MSYFFAALSWIGILFLVIMLFNLVIVVHEWGHFLAARWRGLKIEKFQIWFGKPIWKKTINGVQYGLGTIPFGGFVALPQMASMETIEGRVDADGQESAPLPPISPMDKIIVAFAGPLFSFLLAVAFAFVVWGVGKPVLQTEEEAVIGYVDPERPAGQPGGLMVGDRVTAIDGKPVKRFSGPVESLMWGVVSAENDDIKFSVIRDGKPLDLVIHAATKDEKEFKEWEAMPWWEKIYNRPPMRRVGVAPAKDRLGVEEVLEHSPAALAGIQKGDVLRKLNGQPVFSVGPIPDAIKTAPTAPLELEMERDGKILKFSVTPRIPDEPEDYQKSAPDDNKGEIGLMSFKDLNEAERVASGSNIVHPSPLNQIRESLSATFATLGALISPKSSITPGHMTSAIGIVSIYHQLFSMEHGWRLVFWFTVVLNINLAVLNLLPLPVLDGGHITMALIEGASGRPLRGRIVEYVQASFAVLLLSFMVWVMIKDIGGFLSPQSKPIKFHPPAAEGKS